MSWWRNYFDHEYLRLHDPLFPPARSRREVGAMLELLGLPHDSAILDMPCGWGRHTNLFGEAGHQAIGADISTHFLNRASHEAAHLASQARFVAADLRYLPFRDGVFDAVVNVFTSLGLFLHDQEDLHALREARRVLRPQGRFLLETMHRDDVMAAYAPRDSWTLPDDTRVKVRRRFDPVGGISYESLRWRRGDDGGKKRHALRIRTATEVRDLLGGAGFRDMRYFGHWDQSPFTHRSPHLIVVAVA